MPAPAPVSAGGASVIAVNEVDGVKGFEMFWMDMWEDRFKAPGRLFMFGKYKPNAESEETKSVMVELLNVRRHLYVLPRGDAASDDAGRTAVKEEILGVLRKRLDSQQAVFKTKWEDLSYAFELPNIPRGKASYLKVVYSMALERNAGAIEPGATFEHVFGVNQSGIEALIMQFKLMGPSWIRLGNPTTVERRGLSWCKYEASMDFDQAGSLAVINNRAPPTVSVLSLSLKTIVDPASHQHEIVAAAAVLQDSVALSNASATKAKAPRLAFCMVRAPPGGQIPAGLVAADHISTQASEMALLNCLLAMLHNIDADVLLGHNIEGFELDLLITRMKTLKVAHWSKLGRLNLSQFPKAHRVNGGRQSFYGVLTPGRLVLDTYKLAQELLLGQSVYSLSNLALVQGIIKAPRPDLDPLVVPTFYMSRDRLKQMTTYVVETAQLAWSLAQKLEGVPLTYELTCIGGNLWRRTLGGGTICRTRALSYAHSCGAGRAERIEYLLLHAFSNKGFICPDKAEYNPDDKKRKPVGARQKPAYAGGLVLEPKAGLYDQFVLVLDFNSLYPSIIQEHNICFSTVERPAVDDAAGAASKRGKRVRSCYSMRPADPRPTRTTTRPTPPTTRAGTRTCVVFVVVPARACSRG